MLVDRHQIGPAAAGLAVEHLRLHRKPGEIAGEGVGRAAHQTEAEIRNLAVRAVAAAQVLLRTRLQVVHAVALARFLERHDVAESRIRLQVEQRGISASAAGKGRMRRLVLDALLADVDDAAVADALQILLSGHQHERGLLSETGRCFRDEVQRQPPPQRAGEESTADVDCHRTGTALIDLTSRRDASRSGSIFRLASR